MRAVLTKCRQCCNLYSISYCRIIKWMKVYTEECQVRLCENGSLFLLWTVDNSFLATKQETSFDLWTFVWLPCLCQIISTVLKQILQQHVHFDRRSMLLVLHFMLLKWDTQKNNKRNSSRAQSLHKVNTEYSDMYFLYLQFEKIWKIVVL